MIMGYKNANSVLSPNTRVSNSTIIVSEKNLILEDNVYIGHYNYIEASNNIFIGEGCQITNFVSITSHSSHNAIRLYGKEYIAHNGKHKGYVVGDIEIGKYSFIGPHSVIMPNSIIGKGSIVAAYSYVRDEFPDFAIIAGNPAIKVGDTREIDEELLLKYPELQKYYEEWANK